LRPAHLIKVLEREFLSASEGLHTPVMLWGPPGVGKSQIVQQIAVSHGVEVIDVRLSQMEPSDLRGIPMRVDDYVEWAIPSMLPNAKRHGQTGILFLDEVTSAPPSVSAAAYQLILDRSLGEYKVPEGWAIFAAGNRQGDRGVTYTMPSPLANRFSHFDVDINLDDWVNWAYGKGIDDRLIAFLRFRPEKLFEFDPAHNPVAFPTPRSWEFANNALQKFEQQPELLTETLQACVGPATGIELKAYIDNLTNMPNLDEIVEGKDVRVPAEVDLQYAVATALVGRAIREKGSDDATRVIGNILSFAGNFPQREMGVMMVSDMNRTLGEAMFAVPEFDQWADSIADLMIFGR
jgi:hypothetical protein